MSFEIYLKEISRSEREAKMPKYVPIETGQNRSDLFVTGSVNRDTDKLRTFFNSNSEKLVKAFDVTKNILGLKEDHKLWIRNIRGSTCGHYQRLGKKVSVDIRSYNLKQIISTIIHELTHAKQYETGMLESDPKKRGWKLWKKKSYKFYKSSQNHKKYYESPWEVDARASEKKYIDQVMKEVK